MKYQKIAILSTSVEATVKAEKMLLEAGFKWYGHHPCYLDYPNDSVSLIINQRDIGELTYIHKTKSGYFSLDNCFILLDLNLNPDLIQQFEGANPTINEITIDIEWLLKNDACEGGFKWFVAKYGKGKISSNTVLQDLGRESRWDYIEWVKAKAKAFQKINPLREEVLNEKLVKFREMSYEAQRFIKDNYENSQYYSNFNKTWKKNDVPKNDMDGNAYRIDPSVLDSLLK